MPAARRLGLAGAVFAALLAAGLAGCASLPEDGPSHRQIGPAGVSANARYAVVDVDYRVTQVIAANPSRPLTFLTPPTDARPSDLISVGDTLAVSIFQPSGGFSPQISGPTPTGAEQSNNSSQPSLPRVLVGRDGAINVPFAGIVPVAGLTPDQAAVDIRRALKGKIANPQVIVTPVTSPRNSVIVIGEVKNPGRFAIGANSDRLLDALAVAGGPTKPARDLTLTVVRGDQSATVSVATLLEDPTQNIRLSPQDQIRVLPSLRKVDVFGAVGKGAEIPIEDDTLSLAGALARIGGLNGQTADARSVLLFRYERPEVAKALGVDFPNLAGAASVPIIYRLNLRDPSGYFVAGKFEVEPNDLIYAPTADVAELQKFLQVVNLGAQLFYDAAVAKSLGF